MSNSYEAPEELENGLKVWVDQDGSPRMSRDAMLGFKEPAGVEDMVVEALKDAKTRVTVLSNWLVARQKSQNKS